MSGILELSLMFLVVGACGFTRGGLPLTSKRSLVGRQSRRVGALCLLVGLLGVAFAFWAGTPAERRAMGLVARGIVVGILGTLLVLFRPTAEEDGGAVESDREPD